MKTILTTTLIKCGLCATVLALAGVSSAVAADPFPTKPIRLVVPSSPGGLADVSARQVALKMSETLGQPVIVDNKPGAATLLGTRLVKEAPADGYTILLQSTALTVSPALKKDPGYDLEKDFTAVGAIVRLPFLMVVPASSPDRTLGDFVARAKKDGQKMSYGTGGTGTPAHIAGAIFLQQAGIDLLHVPYKGNAGALADVLGGRLDMLMDPPATSIGHVKSGKVRALGVSSTARLAMAPDIPTFAEQGMANASYTAWIGLVAPAKTPKDVIKRLSDALRGAVSSKDLGDEIRAAGNEPMVMSSDEFNKFLKTDLIQMDKLAKDLKLSKED